MLWDHDTVPFKELKMQIPGKRSSMCAGVVGSVQGDQPHVADCLHKLSGGLATSR